MYLPCDNYSTNVNSEYIKCIDYIERLINRIDCNAFVYCGDYNTSFERLVANITMSLDSGDIVIGVFLNLKKAFDTVDHNILFKKIYQYSIRGNLNKWFKNYLSNRSQYVLFNGITSDIKNVNCGVPQGSILGPLLFILYINDFSNVSDILYYVLFADDTNVFINRKVIHKLINAVGTVKII